MKMLVTDVQVHLWESEHPDRPWPRPQQRPPHRPNGFSAEEMLKEMATAGVDRAIIVPPTWAGDSNAWALEMAARYPNRFAVIGRIDVKAPDARNRLEGWLQQPHMLGVRMSFHVKPFINWLDDGSLNWFWAACEKQGYPVGLLAGGYMQAFGKIAESHPGLKIHIDHLGRHGGGAGGTDDSAWADLPEMLALAKLPNVAVKMSGAPSYSSASYPYKNIHGYLRQVFEAFGPERSFWGTDITRMPCSYRQCVTMFTEELPWLKGRDLERVMGGAVVDWLGWKRPAA
jgi:predicted TIM-barrel fold metal-dependent hydrolase